MSDVRAKYVPPSVKETAFNCPHCGALARQTWYGCLVENSPSHPPPVIMDDAFVATLRMLHREGKSPAISVEFAEKVAKGRPFLSAETRSFYKPSHVHNLSTSVCLNCAGVAIWVHNRLVWPVVGAAPLPNPDMPEDIRLDYEEASTILDLSPRGAAALLRLAVQKLCKRLGEKGKHINDDIASLVAKGLDHRVQQALDVVRVIGNEAVHPGAMDLRDDKATAERLFGLVNLIVERMISYPKHVADMIADLPDTKRDEIERRNAKAAGTPK